MVSRNYDDTYTYIWQILADDVRNHINFHFGKTNSIAVTVPVILLLQVIEAAKRGFHAEGVELNRWLVWFSRYRAWNEGVHKNTKFYRKDIFKTDLDAYDHVIIFGVDTMVRIIKL